MLYDTAGRSIGFCKYANIIRGNVCIVAMDPISIWIANGSCKQPI